MDSMPAREVEAAGPLGQRGHPNGRGRAGARGALPREPPPPNG